LSEVPHLPEPLAATLRPVPGELALPGFARGWLVGGSPPAPYLDYLAGEDAFNWSADLEELHENEGADHFLDEWTRRAVLDGLDLGRSANPVVVDIGCSSGALLRDVTREQPAAVLLGVDAVPSGLRAAHDVVPQVPLLRASALDLPLADASIDAIASLNVLEHLAQDVGSLAEMQRVLRPGGRAAVVVPAGPGLYDFYDRHLQHERRYGRGELSRKAASVGLRIRLDTHLGSGLFPAFWAVKKRNRQLQRSMSPERERELVARQIEGTKDSKVGRVLCGLERRALRRGIRAPFGIRSFVVMERP
jgi:SAM-dependent methyltransferase